MFVVTNQFNTPNIGLSYITGAETEGYLGNATYIRAAVMLAPMIRRGINKNFPPIDDCTGTIKSTHKGPTEI